MQHIFITYFWIFIVILSTVSFASHTYIYIRTTIYILVILQVSTRLIFVHMCDSVRARTHTHTHTCTSITHTHQHAQTTPCASVRAHNTHTNYTCTHPHTNHTHTHTRTHTHTQHTHTHTHTECLNRQCVMRAPQRWYKMTHRNLHCIILQDTLQDTLQHNR